VRGAVSTGFRAPSLPQQFFAAAATNNIGGVLVDAVTLPVSNPVAQALGSAPLKAETSFSWSGGLVFSAVPRLSMTVDYFQIDIDDRIVLTDNLTATRDAAGNPSGTNPGRGIAQILNIAGFTNVSAARFFFNGIDTRRGAWTPSPAIAWTSARQEAWPSRLATTGRKRGSRAGRICRAHCTGSPVLSCSSMCGWLIDSSAHG
jgi:outer membrane receptor for ferrienterochelin and colicin